MLGHGPAEFCADGRGPCVVGFHGFSGTASELRPLLDCIAAAGYAVDGTVLPGHGTLPHFLQDVTFDEWVAAADDRLRRAQSKYGSAVLLGFSLGSLVALQVAIDRQGASGPAGLVLLGSAIRLGNPTFAVLALMDKLPQGPPDLYLLKSVPGDAVDTSTLADLVTYDRHPLRAAVQVYRAGRRIRDAVGGVRCPTLILHGLRDRVCPSDNAVWLADHLGTRDASVHLLEHSAHLVARDLDKESVAEHVLRFLGRFASVSEWTPNGTAFPG
jgi:carboxylesterase